MRKIILVRHAKSSWEHHVPDHERPLNSKGFSDARKISNELIGVVNPDLVMSSHALRAKLTAEIFVANLHIAPQKFTLNQDLYDFSGDSLTEVITSCENSVNELMVFGHNNAITNFINYYGDTYIDNVPTCGVTIIEFEIDSWNDLRKGRTIKTLFPKQLNS